MGDNCEVYKYPGAQKDVMGNYIGFLINGTDASVGVVDMTTLPDDYEADTLNPDGTFRISIEAAGPIEVQLADGTDFTITAVKAGAFVGHWLDMNIRKVYKTGTTGTFSVGW